MPQQQQSGADIELTEEAAANVTIVGVAGRLDTQTAVHFSSWMDELLQSGQVQLLIEASRLSYISSAGLRAMLIAAKSAARSGGRLAVCSMTPRIRRVMEAAGLGSVFDTYPSRGEAIAAIVGRAGL